MTETKKAYTIYAFIIILVMLIVVSFLLIKPYLTAVLTSLILTYFFYPLYARLNRIVRNKSLCSFLMLIIIGLVIIVPLGFLVKSLLNQATSFYFEVKNIDVTPVSDLVLKYVDIDLKFYFQDITTRGIAYVIDSAYNFLVSLPKIIISLLIMIFTMYYLFKEGPNLFERLKSILPLNEKQKDYLFNKFNLMMHATVHGLFITALIQGIVGTIGLFIFKVSSPILWGSVMTIAALLPYFGTAIIWLPASLYKVLANDVINGLGLLLFGLIIISNIDNFIRPKIISKKSRIHPVLVLLGVLGGIKVFGFLGIIIGPVIFTLLLIFLEFLKLELQK